MLFVFLVAFWAGRLAGAALREQLSPRGAAGGHSLALPGLSQVPHSALVLHAKLQRQDGFSGCLFTPAAALLSKPIPYGQVTDAA